MATIIFKHPNFNAAFYEVELANNLLVKDLEQIPADKNVLLVTKTGSLIIGSEIIKNYIIEVKNDDSINIDLSDRSGSVVHHATGGNL